MVRIRRASDAWREGSKTDGGVSMFDYDPPKKKEPTDYTGLILAAILAPVLLLFIYLGKADMGLAAVIAFGMIIFAVKLRWNLRKHVWFWATIVFILALHLPLVFIVRWPQGDVPIIFYSMPIGIADFLIILGAVGLLFFYLMKTAKCTCHTPSALALVGWGCPGSRS
jgi:hypothetical protein